MTIGEIDWWAPARQRALAQLDERQAAAIKRCQSCESYRSELWAIDAERRRVLLPTWVSSRPPRRMPTLWTLATYWAGRDVFDVDLAAPHCFGCSRDDYPYDRQASPGLRWNSLSGYLERAHLVARVYGGLDGPQNIVPLCGRCHRLLPDDDGRSAIAWLLRGGWPAHNLTLTAWADGAEASI